MDEAAKQIVAFDLRVGRWSGCVCRFGRDEREDEPTGSICDSGCVLEPFTRVLTTTVACPGGGRAARAPPSAARRGGTEV